MRRTRLIALVSCIALLAGCSLMPEEETYQSTPIVRSFSGTGFEVAYVTRGDVVRSTKMSCTYSPTSTEVLRFTVGGEYIDETFVKLGDAVHAGDLVMRLNMDGVQDQIDEIEYALKRLDLLKRQLEENRALELERAALAAAGDASALETTRKSVNERYDAALQGYEDEIFLRKSRLAELEAEREKRELRTGIDGTITYVRTIKEGERSVAGDRYAAVADSTTSVFQLSTELWAYFEEGREFTITSNKVEYEAVCASPESLGLDPVEREAGKRATVYLQLKTPTFELEADDRGSFTLIQEERHDVLVLPSEAVFTMGGKTIVYYTDADGVRRYKNVEIGLDNGKVVEIVSGLEENECVLVN